MLAGCVCVLCVGCRDVRTREAGIQDIHHQVQPDNVELIRRDYAANGGWETFLAYEDPRQVRQAAGRVHEVVVTLVVGLRVWDSVGRFVTAPL